MNGVVHHQVKGIMEYLYDDDKQVCNFFFSFCLSLHLAYQWGLWTSVESNEIPTLARTTNFHMKFGILSEQNKDDILLRYV